jgi:hypothetical protein
VYGASGGRARRVSTGDPAQPTVTVSFRIDVQNASGTTLALQTATLTGGVWVPAPPAIGSAVFPGGAPSYLNSATQSFSGLGGTLIFVPNTGGSITVGWSWPSGKAPSAAASAQRTSIPVRGQLINVGSSEPVFQVLIGSV